MQALAVQRRACSEDLARLVAAVEHDGAFFQQALGILHQLRIVAIAIPHLFFTAKAFIGPSQFFRR